jgi:hypothetical protein
MTEATANLASNTPSKPSVAVKVAREELIILEDSLPPQEIQFYLTFEDIGGQEMINIARHDLVNGQDVVYQAIKNLAAINFQYNPQNILALQDADLTYFKNFPISFESKVPDCGTGYTLSGTSPNIERVPNCKIVYLEPETGNIIINVINLQKDEQVEIEILSSGTVLNGTIYEAV